MDMRTDKGALWDNFLISERFKYLGNNELDIRSWFWRTTRQQEIDYIEQWENKLLAFEFKWNAQKKVRLSKTFSKAYSNNKFKMITPEYFHEFVMKE